MSDPFLVASGPDKAAGTGAIAAGDVVHSHSYHGLAIDCTTVKVEHANHGLEDYHRRQPCSHCSLDDRSRGLADARPIACYTVAADGNRGVLHRVHRGSHALVEQLAKHRSHTWPAAVLSNPFGQALGFDWSGQAVRVKAKEREAEVVTLETWSRLH